MIQKLDWDSNFFERSIGKIEIRKFNELKNQPLDSFNFFYLESLELLNQDKLKTLVKKYDLQVVYYEQKNTYSKPLNELYQIGEIKVLTRTQLEPTEELVYLGLQSGEFSRFKKCPVLGTKFEKLYRTWVINSLKGKIADEVFVIFQEEIYAGIVTSNINNQILNIGIIAVSEKLRGKGIGKNLLRLINNYALKKGCIEINVATQEQNRLANKFYLNSGFNIKTRKFIYHLSRYDTI